MSASSLSFRSLISFVFPVSGLKAVDEFDQNDYNYSLLTQNDKSEVIYRTDQIYAINLIWFDLKGEAYSGPPGFQFTSSGGWGLVFIVQQIALYIVGGTAVSELFGL